jgi:SEC-C motif-containing protein
MLDCPCGNKTPYAACCGLYIESNVAAPTPEALMRSRYSAYSQANVDYVAKTMQGIAAKGFDFEASKHWAQQVTWLGLTVTSQKMKTPKIGFVIFEAKYSEKGEVRIIREKSEFHLINDRWYYVAGKTLNPHKGIT